MYRCEILVVEDEGIVARDIQATLERLGYSITGTVASGEEAINMARYNHPDLVLMDIVLKGPIDGIEAAQKIRDELDIPVIYLTANADEATVERAKLTEPFGYILKPFEERELHTVVEMALHKHRLERQLQEREQWLSAVLRSIGDGVIATDDVGRVRFMNRIAEELTGWSQAEALDRQVGEIVPLSTGASGREEGLYMDKMLQASDLVERASYFRKL